MKYEDNRVTPREKGTDPDFYDTLPECKDFTTALTRSGDDVPENWYIAITDVPQSTIAVEQGEYKKVNVAGALAIIALGRIYGTLKRPFLFGGDGMTFLIDPEHATQARETLSRVMYDVKTLFSLDLRAALIPVSFLYGLGYELRVNKVRMSPTYLQAQIYGSGVSAAESFLKTLDPQGCSFFIQPQAEGRDISYEGFTCRWQDVPSPNGETVALIVEPQSGGEAQVLLREIETIIGTSEQYHPLRPNLMKAGGKKSGWKLAALVTHRKSRGLAYRTSLFLEFIGIAILNFSIRFHIPIKYKIYNLSKAREQNVGAADFKKYEGAIKLIFSASTQKVDSLFQRLTQLYQQGICFYGIHRTKAAHMTCIASLASGDDIHFVDAVNGGYSYAAKQLKAQKEGVHSKGSTTLYQGFSRAYEDIFPLGEKTQDFLGKLLEPGGRFLDLGCATGQLARTFWEGGSFVLGIDQDRELIQQGLSCFPPREKGEPPLQEGNIFDPELYTRVKHHGPFDLVTCLGNTLVHARDGQEVEAFLQGIEKVLSPNGTLVLSFLHYDVILSEPDFVFPVIHNPPYVFYRTYSPRNDGKLGFHIRLIHDKQQLFLNNLELYPLVLRELRSFAHKGGFRIDHWYGDFTGKSLDSSDIMVVAVLRKAS